MHKTPISTFFTDAVKLQFLPHLFRIFFRNCGNLVIVNFHFVHSTCALRAETDDALTQEHLATWSCALLTLKLFHSSGPCVLEGGKTESAKHCLITILMCFENI